MNLDKMLHVLEAEARESGERTLADARAQADEIIKQAENEGRQMADNSLKEAQAKLALERSKALSAANFFVKKEMLKAQEEVVDQFFTKLKEGAVQEGSSNEALFKKLAQEALAKFQGQEVLVFVNSSDKGLAEKVLSNLGVKYQVKNTLNCIGGLKVQSVNGHITVDNTIDSRLKKVKQVFEPDIAFELFGEQS